MTAGRGRDRIMLQEMSFFAFHGVLPGEKKHGQHFQVSLQLYLDLHTAGQTDNLQDTVDYAAVYEEVKTVMEGPSRDLLESLAETIAARVLRQPVRGVIVEVRKLAPPVAGRLSSAAVCIERGDVS